MTESDIKRTILLRLGARPDTLVWNHPTGCARAMHPPHQVITYGCVGSPDIIGCKSVTIPHSWVGRQVGLAIGVEVKTPTGRQSEQQRKFQAAWTARGGLYILATSADEAEEGLQ